MPLKYFLSRTCAGSGRLFGYDFITFLGQFLQINSNNYDFYMWNSVSFVTDSLFPTSRYKYIYYYENARGNSVNNNALSRIK